MRKILSLIGGLTIFISGAIAIGIGYYMDWDTQKMAKVLPGEQNPIGTIVDAYKGAPVYENGIIFTESYGKNYSKDGYYYGQKWQCVEFVKRFYYDVKSHKMPNGFGNARDFFNNQLAQGAFNAERGLYQYLNGGNVKPEPDDLVVFQTGNYGHVAIITRVSDNEIEIIQQNLYAHPRKTYKMVVKNGKYFVGDGDQPVGWLRKGNTPSNGV